MSRYLRVQPLENRYATTLKDVFLKMINIDDPLPNPINVWVDQGKDFKGVFAKFCVEKKLKFTIHTVNPKAVSRNVSLED